MFRTLIYQSSGACDYYVELPHWPIVLGSMCVGVSVWLGWGVGIRVAGFSLQHGYQHSNTHRTKNNTTNVVIQHNSRKLLMMDILMCETCWAHEKWNKIASDTKLVFYSWTMTNSNSVKHNYRVTMDRERSKNGIQRRFNKSNTNQNLFSAFEDKPRNRRKQPIMQHITNVRGLFCPSTRHEGMRE